MGLDLHPLSELLRWFGRNTKRLAVLVAGLGVLGAGVTMLVLPGPGLIVIILGFAILATEFAWAERALDRTTSTAAAAASRVTNNRTGKVALALSALAMITGGAIVATFVGDYRVAGLSIAVAGVVGLITLVPRVQRWIDGKATRPAAVAVAADDTADVTGVTVPDDAPDEAPDDARP
ncbi:MAG: PGPGW domain-containing protein [Actinomycetota bacterium]|jgi:uncharacterized protein (TIGR02611 family)|nr:hypothetical protein [Actinomycetota bacterium]